MERRSKGFFHKGEERSEWRKRLGSFSDVIYQWELKLTHFGRPLQTPKSKKYKVLGGESREAQHIISPNREQRIKEQIASAAGLN